MDPRPTTPEFTLTLPGPRARRRRSIPWLPVAAVAAAWGLMVVAIVLAALRP